MAMPPTAPPKPPIPTMEPTARRGNMSDDRVNMLHDQPWWAAVAGEISAPAGNTNEPRETATRGVTAIAQMSMAVLRAALRRQPRFSRVDETHPPPMLPTSAE